MYSNPYASIHHEIADLYVRWISLPIANRHTNRLASFVTINYFQIIHTCVRALLLICSLIYYKKMHKIKSFWKLCMIIKKRLFSIPFDNLILTYWNTISCEESWFFFFFKFFRNLQTSSIKHRLNTMIYCIFPLILGLLKVLKGFEGISHYSLCFNRMIYHLRR